MAIKLELDQYKYQCGTNKRKLKDDDDIKEHKRPKWPGPLPPLLIPDLKIVFVGFNPGIMSGEKGHYYAHHSNRFWKLLHQSGFTPRQLTYEDDHRLPGLYSIGFTDLVPRCTKGIQQLNKQELEEGAMSLEKRISEYDPKYVCLVGKGIWEAIAKAKNWDRKAFKYGIDPVHKFGKSSVLCCVPSSSGLNSMTFDKQIVFWKEVKEAVSNDSI